MSHTDDPAALLGLVATPGEGWLGPVRGHDSYDGRGLAERAMAFRTRMLHASALRTGWRRRPADTVLFRHPPHGTAAGLRLWLGDESGRVSARPLGLSPGSGEPFQHTVPGGHWFAVELTAGELGLWSEAVVPGAEFDRSTADPAQEPPGLPADLDAQPADRTVAPADPGGTPTVRDALKLTSHVEGGYYRQYYESATSVHTSRGPRPTANTIHYLLDQDSPVGHLHLNTAHITHFLNSGGPIRYLLLAPDGEVHEVTMGDDLAAGQVLTFTCPGGWWKTSRLVDGAGHGLISEMVAPGFDFRDQAIARAEQIAGQFPAAFEVLRPYISG
ncbi:cupin domain-containing protein [Streptomyces sp. HUAS TT20]|uniref:cupin domain-containing protein n=1 Tax=Streptomyces sp. HUAS TT20 TaxID=3447509 RepID=UPI0021DAD426|nr:cupin domain-containing protein [Streptomyces sp. HUAS 15-9]UXY33126.1 cupin domain-containing protein [Streptomyces sp. HUAS 15-9]